MTDYESSASPNSQAREAGLQAVERTRRCLDEMEQAMEAGDWRSAGLMYAHLSILCEIGTDACRRLTVVSAERN